MTVGRGRGDSGATLLIFVFSVVLLITLVAFAVDLGQARFASRDNQQAADLAALSAGFQLAGQGSNPPMSQPRAACEAAFNSASTNLGGFAATTAQISSACVSFPVDDSSCVSTPPASATVMITRSITVGEYTVAVEWPVPLTELTDARFSGSGLLDGTDNCDRMRVDVDRRQDTAFAGVIGVGSLKSDGGAVVLGAPASTTEGIAALLILEREGCGALQRSGQGKVIVKTVTDPVSGDEQPGVIQADSAGSSLAYGTGLECQTSGGGSPQDNSSGYVIYASCTGTNLPGIVAEPAPSGEAGVIATYAQRLGSSHAASCYSGTGSTGLNVDPIGSSITSRRPADTRFNPDARPAISDLHTAAYAATVSGGAATSGTVLSGAPNCRPDDGTVFADAGTVTLSCGTAGFQVGNNRTVSFPNATAVKFIGGVEVGAGAQLDLPAAATVEVSRATPTDSAPLTVAGTTSFGVAQNVYVGGEPATCFPMGNCEAVEVSGTLRVNTGAIGTETCAEGPGSGGSETNWTQFATVGGALEVSGSVSLCQTMFYVGKPAASYAPSQRTFGGLNCSTSRPCPELSAAAGFDRVQLSGGSSSIIWSAPDQTSGVPDITNPFEGLALWAEGTGLSEIKGTGTLLTTGVFFLPNALFEFDGQAAAANPFNAQFFTRTLNFSGLGDLNLSPDPRDSVPTPIPGTFALIR